LETQTNNRRRDPYLCTFTFNGLRDQFSSGKKVMAEHWNEDTGFAIKACKDAAAINTYITYTRRELKSAITTHVMDTKK
jgi:hypothetical protein